MWQAAAPGIGDRITPQETTLTSSLVDRLHQTFSLTLLLLGGTEAEKRIARDAIAEMHMRHDNQHHEGAKVTRNPEAMKVVRVTTIHVALIGGHKFGSIRNATQAAKVYDRLSPAFDLVQFPSYLQWPKQRIPFSQHVQDVSDLVARMARPDYELPPHFAGLSASVLAILTASRGRWPSTCVT
jgi:uncharacterized protein (DUF2236 family)